ncbi:MAG TPA: hypothetical protein DCY51_01750 [Bacteroidetes bacterium]|nr:hypothetical protein [Bacteroidota bacterium]
MDNGQLTSYKTVLERLHSIIKMDFELIHADALEQIGGLMRRLKVRESLTDDVAKIPIEDGRGSLPCDLERIIQTGQLGESYANGTPFGVTPSQLFTQTENDVVEEGSVWGANYGSRLLVEYSSLTANTPIYPMRYATDTMHMRYHCCDFDFNTECESTYQIQGGNIFTNFDEGCVVMAYRKIPVDEDGFPMIPDNDSWILACAYELAYNICIGLFSVGKINERFFHFIRQQRAYYIMQAGNVFRMSKTVDQMEASTNEWTRFIPRNSHHGNFFKNFQSPEREYKVHR